MRREINGVFILNTFQSQKLLFLELAAKRRNFGPHFQIFKRKKSPFLWCCHLSTRSIKPNALVSAYASKAAQETDFSTSCTSGVLAAGTAAARGLPPVQGQALEKSNFEL